MEKTKPKKLHLTVKILIGLLRLLSWLPLPVLYLFSDVCYPVIYYLVRYRRAVVRANIAHSFPEMTEAERRRVERRFYRFLCDYGVETLKLLTMSEEEMKRRMVVEGVDDMERSLERCPFVFIYLGHYCNWEWISSIPLWVTRATTHCGQLYRPLESKAFDELFYKMRTRFGSANISKYDALRQILEMRRRGERTIIGFISDQSPKPNSIHDWVDFLHQDTPVFTGTERIAKKVDAAIYFADVRRVKRGYYRLHLPGQHDAHIPHFIAGKQHDLALGKSAGGGLETLHGHAQLRQAQAPEQGGLQQDGKVIFQ